MAENTALLVVMSLLLAVVCLVLVVIVLGCVMRAFRTTKRRKRGFDTIPNPYAQQGGATAGAQNVSCLHAVCAWVRVRACVCVGGGADV